MRQIKMVRFKIGFLCFTSCILNAGINNSQAQSLNNSDTIIIHNEKNENVTENDISNKVGKNEGLYRAEPLSKMNQNAIIEFNKLEPLMTTTVEDLLQGRMASLEISSLSSDLGVGQTMRFRGAMSLNGNCNPLIVVNDIPYTPNLFLIDCNLDNFRNNIDILPEDIESIEIIRDPALIAQWGTKASNGVLSIKTKRGQKSKPTFIYNYKLTRINEPKAIPMLDGSDYSMLIAESFYNTGSGTDFLVNRDPNRQISYNPDWLGDEYWNYSQNTNWIEEITQFGLANEHNLSIQGGGNKFSYSNSIGYSKEEGTTMEQYQDKLNLKSSLDYKLTDKISVSSDIFYTKYDLKTTYDNDFSFIDIRTMAYLKMPNLSVYERDENNNVLENYFTPLNTLQGSGLEYYNPVAFAKLGENKRITNNIRASLTAKYNISDFLTYLGTVSFDLYNQKINKTLPVSEFGFSNINDSIFTKKSSVINKQIYFSNRLVFKPNIGDKNSLKMQLHFDTDNLKYTNEYLYFNTLNKELNTYGASLFIDYKYKSKYLFSTTYRSENIDELNIEKNWNNFMTFSAGWLISQESFLKNSKYINTLKIEASWENSNISSFNNWDQIQYINPRISISLLNRVNLYFDVFQRKYKELLPEGDLEIRNRGWELFTNVKIIEKKDWSASIDFNLSHNENVILSLPNDYQTEFGNIIDNGNYLIPLQKGATIGDFYGYNYLGVYKDVTETFVRDANGNPVYEIGSTTPIRMIHPTSSGAYYEFKAGDAHYKDEYNDSRIDEKDVVYLGNVNPKLMGGVSSNIKYKGLSLNLLFYFKTGYSIINQVRMDNEKMYNFDNQSASTNRRWRSPGEITDMPRALYNEGYNWLGSSRFIENGAFLKLKSISIGYEFNKKVCRIFRINDLMVYGTFYNPVTWTKYTGIDPDIPSISSLNGLSKDNIRSPTSVRYTFGIRVSF